MDTTKKVFQSVFEMLPGPENPTPLCRINALNPVPGFALYAKLEWMNPFGSVKDRAAWALVRQLESQGKLGEHEHGKRGLVEPTSGNTGISLAAIASVRGYSMRAVVPEKVPLEKQVMLRIAGANVDVVSDALCPAPGMPEGAIGLAMSYARAQGNSYTMPNQYENQANAEAHYRTTGPEIWRQTDGKITHFFTSLGTCGTVTGTSRFLKEMNPHIKVIAVQPSPGHDVPGLRNLSELHVSKLFDPSLIDEIIQIDFEKAYTTALELCQREGLFAGPSSGLIFEGARQVLTRDRASIEAIGKDGGVGVAIFCDSIFKYISSMVKHIPALAGEGT
jgi:S-sulfo-L-cysteine synthase (O-acetyl-L-serine-dependent)